MKIKVLLLRDFSLEDRKDLYKRLSPVGVVKNEASEVFIEYNH